MKTETKYALGVIAWSFIAIAGILLWTALVIETFKCIATYYMAG